MRQHLKDLDNSHLCLLTHSNKNHAWIKKPLKMQDTPMNFQLNRVQKIH